MNIVYKLIAHRKKKLSKVAHRKNRKNCHRKNKKKFQNIVLENWSTSLIFGGMKIKAIT